MATRLTFVAHAATEAQRHAAFPLDEPISERERARLANLDRIHLRAERMWSAPEQRTLETSRILGLTVTIAEDLRDCDYGRWRGRSMDRVQTEEPNGIAKWLSDPRATPHGGESIERLVDRVGKWMDKQRDAKHTIAVTHPAVIRAGIIYALRLPVHNFWRFDVASLTITDLRFNRDVWTVRCSGCSLPTTKQDLEES